MKSTFRNFATIISEICTEEGIQLKAYSSDWVLCLNKKDVYNYIIGYQFGLNSASVNSICSDKCAASEVMTSLGIPNVEHYFFMSPMNSKYAKKTGSWNDMTEMLKKYGKLVCKTNEGSGGNMVFCVRTQYELEKAALDIFRKKRSMAISPYYNIEDEYRLIVLNGKIKLVYKKQRPYIIGDGIHTVNQLLIEYIAKNEGCSSNEVDTKDYGKILEKGETFNLNWKHNLGQGAHAQMVNLNLIPLEMKKIVSALVNKMNIQFASVDIIRCLNTYRVLEINSGVMMEHFSQENEEMYNIAKEIYREAVLTMMKGKIND